jgi:hypothetical protein
VAVTEKGWRCLLCVPRVKGISSRAAFRPQLPLGHVMVGSNLIGGRHDVRLLDADERGWSVHETVSEIAAFRPDCLLVGMEQAPEN